MRLEEPLEVTTLLMFEKAMIHVDRNQIIRVIANMVSNALKFTSADGFVTITSAVERVPDSDAEPRSAKLTDPHPQYKLRICVTDNGAGISKVNYS